MKFLCQRVCSIFLDVKIAIFFELFSSLFICLLFFIEKNILHILQRPGFPDVPGRPHYFRVSTKRTKIAKFGSFEILFSA
jgi:hypothetical protein